jgi:hypothetical protein
MNEHQEECVSQNRKEHVYKFCSFTDRRPLLLRSASENLPDHRTQNCIHFVPKVALLLSIREVSSSNLGQESNYSEFLCGFPQSFQANSAIGIK